MNFKEWYSQPLIRNNFDKTEAYNVWQACKQEVLKILNNPDNHFNPNIGNSDAIDIKVIWEIQKL